MSATSPTAFLDRLSEAVARYRAEVAGPREHLSLLRWQIAQGDALDRRDTFPGHVTTSAYVLSPDHAQIEEVHAATWKPVDELADIAPLALARIRTLKPPG